MIQSMTGFGKATGELDKRKVTVEIKSLNSKQFDLSVRIPSMYRENEMELRSMLSKNLERGKIDLLIYVESSSEEFSNQINQDVLKSYHKQIVEASQNLGVELPRDWFQTLIRMPDVLSHQVQEATEGEWKLVLKIIEEALCQIQEFRKQEGAMLEKVFREKIAKLFSLLKQVEPLEQERLESVKTRMHEALTKLQDYDYDKNRFEQEMIYHIERLDINEEKTRLENHLKYFLETLDIKGEGQGKKLGFIVQEIGREINTMGSKSNHAEMQQTVVQMKDELEQMKEQTLNVL